jgi:hypothetical protein
LKLMVMPQAIHWMLLVNHGEEDQDEVV